MRFPSFRRFAEYTASALLSLVACACQTDAMGRRLSQSSEPGAAPNEAAPAVTGAAPSEAREPLAPLTQPAQPLNVILLSVGAWRADMPWTGYPRQVAPNLTQLAAESVVWENHRAVSGHGAQSLGAVLSGRFTSTLYRDGSSLTGYSVENSFFPEALQAKGIRTLAVQADLYFERGRGLEQGFDVWENLVSAAEGPEPPSSSRRSEPLREPLSTSSRSIPRLMDLLSRAENTNRQFFAWAHLTDPRAPHPVHAEAPDFGTRPRDRYDGEVFLTDLWLGKFLDFARQQPWWARTALIVTGDQGSALGEHGVRGHAVELWDVMLRTPLLIHAPGAKPVHIAAARTHLDLAPTIVELMGLEAAPEFQGRSLVPELYGAQAEPRPALLFESCEDSANPGLRALIVGEDKLIAADAGGQLRLFDLRQDPGERRNLAESKAEENERKLRSMAVRLEREFSRVPSILPYGGMKLRSGRLAQGPERPGGAAPGN